MSAPAPGRRAQTVALLRQALSLQGRLRRRGFWRTFVAFAVLDLSVQFVALAVLSASHPFSSRAQGVALLAPVATAMEVIFLWPAAAALVRRGHDRGYPALRSLAVLGALAALGLATGRIADGARLLLQVAILAYFIADYGFTPGTRGANGYGEDPRSANPGARA